MDNIFLEIIIITLLSFFQSIFGVGLLLYGTPIFLILGNDFLYSLSILLPVSMVISLLQLPYNNSIFRIKFVKLFSFITLPFLIITLLVLIKFYKNIDIKLLVSFVIIFFSLNNLIFSKFMSKFFLNIKNQYIVFSFIGIIHGLTNLGGSLLAITSSQINSEKNIARVCIAYGYFAMGLLQLILIFFFTNTNFQINKLFYILIPILIFKVSQKFYVNLTDLRFSMVLNIITLTFGLYLFFSIN